MASTHRRANGDRAHLDRGLSAAPSFAAGCACLALGGWCGRVALDVFDGRISIAAKLSGFLRSPRAGCLGVLV